MPVRRILYYNHTRLVSGAERMLLNMLAVLDRERYIACVACPTEGPGELDGLVRQQGVRVIAAPLLHARFTSDPVRLAGYLRSVLSAILRFRGQLLREAPDLIHANSVRAGIVATLATLGTGIPVLWHVQDNLPRHPISSAIRLMAYVLRRTKLVAVSQATARAFAGGLNFGTRLHVLYNAIDQRRFSRKTQPLDAAAMAVREELKLGPAGVLYVAAGMINPRKGLMELVDAWSAMTGGSGMASRTHLAIVGAPIFNDDWRYEAALKERVQERQVSETVHFMGPRQDMPAVLRAADVLVLNAFAEPFGLVLVEAMASGTPVLATRVGGIPEIVTDGKTGLLVDSPGLNGENFARLAHPALQPGAMLGMAEAAYTKLLPRFCLPEFRLRLHELYRSLDL